MTATQNRHTPDHTTPGHATPGHATPSHATPDLALYTQYLALQAQLTALARAYYTPEDTDTETPDSVYDALLAELKALEQTHPHLSADLPASSASARVAHGTASNPQTHPSAMLSLDNVHSQTDLQAFLDRLGSETGQSAQHAAFTVEHKYDGLSANLIYQNGTFSRALTRGDGVTGEDISAQLQRIGVPPTVRGDLAAGTTEIRGEILLPRAELARINAENEQSGGRIFKNARNAAVGILRKNGRNVEALRFIAYGSGRTGTFMPETQVQLMDEVTAQGFTTGPLTALSGPDALEAAHRELERNQDALPYDVDGTVLKLNSLPQQREAGFTSRAPRWATAYKFVTRTVPTTLLGISVNVGKSGRLAPLAHLAPVLVDGSTISSATLNNEAFIRALDLRVGDTVLVGKASSVIPEISGHLPGAPRGPEPYVFPLTCPACGGETVLPEGKADRRCINDDCQGRNFRRLLFFTGPDGMNLKGFGESVLRALQNAGLLRDAADLYSLNAQDVAAARTTDDDGNGRVIGVSTASRLIAQVDASRQSELPLLIRGLAMRHTGKGTAKRLAAVAKTLPGLLAMSETDMAAITDIGLTTAQSLHRELHSPRLESVLRRMVAAGVSPAEAGNVRASDDLQGLTFVLTGSLSQVREQIEAHIEKHGGRASGSVTAKTSYLVAGPGGGSKLQKAADKNVPVLDEAAFWTLLAERNVPAM